MTEIFDSTQVGEWHGRVEDLKQQAEAIFHSHCKQLDAYADSLAQRRRPEDGVVPVDPQERHYLKQVHTRRVNQMDRDLREQSAGTVKRLIREASEVGANGSDQLAHYQPDRWLARRTVASPKRAQYTQTLASVGPRELEVYATQARATGDFDLAAAVLSRASQFGHKQLPFNITEFVDSLAYPVDYTVARSKLEAGQREAQTLVQRLSRFQASGNPGLSPLQKITRGLAQNRGKAKRTGSNVYGYSGPSAA